MKRQDATGFNQREVDHFIEHGWTELPMFCLAHYLAKFKDEHQPFGVGLDELDHMLPGDMIAKDGASGGPNHEPLQPGSK